MCGICGKRCRSFEYLRDHLIGIILFRIIIIYIFLSQHLDGDVCVYTNYFFNSLGPLPKAECERVFRYCRCTFCLNILSGSHALRFHQDRCQLWRGNNMELLDPAVKGTLNVPKSAAKAQSLKRVVFTGYSYIWLQTSKWCSG
ncbi:putative transcription factor C2H2 family [Helianthus anomalus]